MIAIGVLLGIVYAVIGGCVATVEWATLDLREGDPGGLKRPRLVDVLLWTLLWPVVLLLSFLGKR